ncbi:hypothetical protein G3O07_22940, partial [Pseudomonas laurentiana]|nr:hypothetical protein [Pseudomonas laurentiana]
RSSGARSTRPGEKPRSSTRTGPSTKASRNPLRFQGQYYDHETGLHYNRYRYNDPLIGRLGEKRILLI